MKKNKRKRGIWGQDWEFEEKHIIEYRGKGKPIHMPALQHAEGAKKFVRSGIWTHALSRGPELESGALDHSAILTLVSHLIQIYYIDNYYYLVSQNLRYAIIWKMIKIHFRNTKSFKIQYLQHTYIEF